MTAIDRGGSGTVDEALDVLRGARRILYQWTALLVWNTFWIMFDVVNDVWFAVVPQVALFAWAAWSFRRSVREYVCLGVNEREITAMIDELQRREAAPFN